MKQFTLIAIFLTTIIDSLGWSIVFPIFAPLFLTGNLFSPEISIATRTTILGVFLTAYSLGQFIGAPIIGEYADCHGRKKALCGTVFMTFIGFALTAWSVKIGNLYVLFAGRIITGFFAANMAICLTAISDLGGKAKYFGYLSACVGLSFIFGAFLGGKLSDPTVSSLFSPDLPLWIATGLTLVNFIFVILGFRETKRMEKKVKFDLFNCVKMLRLALETRQLKLIYSIFFLFLFAWTMIFQFTPVVMVRDFSFTNSNIGDLALFMGICWALGSGYANKILLYYFSSLKILEWCLVVFTVLSALFIAVTKIYDVLSIVAGCVMLGGMAYPLCNSLISSLAPKGSKGKVLGISQSVTSLAMCLAPTIGGVAYQLFEGFPFLIAALSSLAASAIYFSLKKA